jgi:hypothetical protein
MSRSAGAKRLSGTGNTHYRPSKSVVLNRVRRNQGSVTSPVPPAGRPTGRQVSGPAPDDGPVAIVGSPIIEPAGHHETRWLCSPPILSHKRVTGWAAARRRQQRRGCQRQRQQGWAAAAPATAAVVLQCMGTLPSSPPAILPRYTVISGIRVCHRHLICHISAAAKVLCRPMVPSSPWSLLFSSILQPKLKPTGGAGQGVS